MTPSLWCEARCHYMSDPEPVECLQTAPGDFGAKNGAEAARAAGWKVVDGEWCCPMCFARKAVSG